MSDIFSFLPTLKDIPISKIIFFVKIGLMATGVYNFINGAYAIITKIENLNLETYVTMSILVTFVIIGVSIIVAIVCAYVYKTVKKIIET